MDNEKRVRKDTVVVDQVGQPPMLVSQVRAMQLMTLHYSQDRASLPPWQAGPGIWCPVCKLRKPTDYSPGPASRGVNMCSLQARIEPGCKQHRAAQSQGALGPELWPGVTREHVQHGLQWLTRPANIITLGAHLLQGSGILVQIWPSEGYMIREGIIKYNPSSRKSLNREIKMHKSHWPIDPFPILQFDKDKRSISREEHIMMYINRFHSNSNVGLFLDYVNTTQQAFVDITYIQG